MNSTGTRRLTLMLITASAERAAEAERAGVDRIFVDLEILGKRERQGGLDTVISGHALEDAAGVGKALRTADLLVRVNPLHPGTRTEVEGALAAGAKHLMLPMFHSSAELASFCRIVGNRARVVGLVETREAADTIDEVVRVPGLSEVFVGLNDLSISLSLPFLFEPLGSGLLDRLSAAAHAAGLPFGFGGIARAGEGLLPRHLVLGEHLRLGSTSVILSRAFHQGEGIDLAWEVDKLRALEKTLAGRSPAEVESDRLAAREAIERIAREKRQ